MARRASTSVPGGTVTVVTDTERALIASRVLAKCDALDSAADGLVQDVAACQAAFNLADDVPTCSGARDGTCLTAEQKTVLQTIFDGPKTSSGQRIYASFPYDAGFGSSGVPAWEYVAAMDRDSGALGFIWQIPPANPVGFSGVSYALNTDIDALYANLFTSNGTYAQSAMSFMTPPDPTNMQSLRNRGGKIMVYHGVSDSIFSVNDSEAWFKGVSNDTGDDFARFYRVPGMGHCSGGPATDQFDMLTPLVNWVEKGVAPAESANTTHITVADSEGRIVSATQTINSVFGARYMVPGTGMIPNNYLYVLDPRSDRANSMAPGKRVTSSMAPLMVIKNGKPRYALGLPGGLRIFTSALQAVINLIDHGMSLQEAVEAPRIWTQGFELELEPGFSQAMHAALQTRGRGAGPAPSPLLSVAGQ